MKKTKFFSLLFAVLMLLQLLALPVFSAAAEAAPGQDEAQAAGDTAAAEDDSVPEDQLLSSRASFSVAAKSALLIDLNTGRVVYE